MGHGTLIDKSKNLTITSAGEVTTVILSVSILLVYVCLMGHGNWIDNSKRVAVFYGGEFTTVIRSVLRDFASVNLYHGPWNLDR